LVVRRASPTRGPGRSRSGPGAGLPRRCSALRRRGLESARGKPTTSVKRRRREADGRRRFRHEPAPGPAEPRCANPVALRESRESSAPHPAARPGGPASVPARARGVSSARRRAQTSFQNGRRPSRGVGIRSGPTASWSIRAINVVYLAVFRRTACGRRSTSGGVGPDLVARAHRHPANLAVGGRSPMDRPPNPNTLVPSATATSRDARAPTV